MPKTTIRALASLAVACLILGAAASTASAQQSHGHSHGHGKTQKHGHDHAAMVKHGGSIAEIGDYDAEVVIDDGKVMVYIYDEHGDDITAKASKGDAIFVVDGGSKRVELAMVEGRLQGELGFKPSSEDVDTVLRLTIDGKTHTGKAEVHVHH